jgi:Transposase DDE domain
LILDSTGLRFGKASHWYETKYGKPCTQKPWSKMHLSMDPEINMHGIEITDYEMSDIEVIDALISKDDGISVDKVIADGAYYSIERAERLQRKGIIPVIPPPSHAVVHGQADTTWYDRIVQYIKDKGIVYAFHKKYGYGARSLVEAQISRIKRCIGSLLKTQKDEPQKREGIIIANIINRWNSFGRCVSVKIA